MGLALYRTYRPGSLAEVIGQEHVTEPLARALTAGRTHHAYLFSGPRGCGKTSTARIIARSLNCEQGPTAEPCGSCRSCVELAPNGPGSIDVVELDAATHRGIDDARELREKAIYAPAASRYKIYIIDEAHQLTNEAANALLKLVEEPPPHLRFIFATTEPDKIIPTIRSRTFHYGFRLVPARLLAEHLAEVCAAEGVAAEAPALAAVARAGAGSVRDSLSVLGQLLAGAGPEGLTYVDAVSALGLTDAGVIDGFVSALAQGSPAAMFAVVEDVISAGHDPRRFVTDVLERLRDLIILRADPSALSSGLVEVPDDAGERLLEQAGSLSLAELSRAADLVSHGLGEVKGATAPRLQLELLCARLALPADGDDLATLAARLDRLERGLPAPAAPEPGPAVPTPAPVTSPAPSTGPSEAGQPPTVPVAPAGRPPAQPPAPGPEPADAARAGRPPAPPRRPTLRTQTTGVSEERPASEAREEPVTTTGAQVGEGTPAPADVAPPAANTGMHESATPPAAPPASPGGSSGPAGAPGNLEVITRAWEDILSRLASDSRVAWTAFHSATPVSVADGALAVAVAEPGHVRAIAQRGHDERLRQAILDVLGMELSIDVLHDPASAGAGAAGSATSGGASRPGAAAPTGPRTGAPSGASRRPAPSAAPGGRPARAAASTATAPVDPEVVDEPSEDDPDVSGSDGLALVTRELGARPIGEIDHS